MNAELAGWFAINYFLPEHMPGAQILRVIRFYVPTAEFHIHQSGLESCAGVFLPQRQRIKFSYISTLSTFLSVGHTWPFY